jgi:hypothetical protein
MRGGVDTGRIDANSGTERKRELVFLEESLLTDTGEEKEEEGGLRGEGENSPDKILKILTAARTSPASKHPSSATQNFCHTLPTTPEHNTINK